MVNLGVCEDWIIESNTELDSVSCLEVVESEWHSEGRTSVGLKIRRVPVLDGYSEVVTADLVNSCESAGTGFVGLLASKVDLVVDLGVEILALGCPPESGDSDNCKVA